MSKNRRSLLASAVANVCTHMTYGHLSPKISSTLDASNWSKPISTVGQINVNEGKKLRFKFGTGLATYPNSLRKLYRNQSGLKIDLIDMNGA